MLLGIVAFASMSFTSPEPERSRLEMKNVHFRVLESVTLQVRSLRGSLEPTGDPPPYFDEPTSLRIEISSAEVAVRPESLAALLNEHVFAYPDAPIEQIEIRIEDGVVEQTGVLKKAVSVPFELEGKLEPTSKGDVRYRTTSVQAADIPVEGLMISSAWSSRT